jgi:membrane protein YqaA with SNARE-associated domain
MIETLLSSSELVAYLGLFIISFVAATLLPLGSELALLAMLESGFSPSTCLLVASFGNVLGSLVNYGLGVWLGHKLLQPNRWINPQKLKGAIDRYRRWGMTSQLLAWVPIIGDPLTFAAGVLRINLIGFLVLVTIGKVGRYAIVIASSG